MSVERVISTSAKRASWAVALFYAVIALEFFYMASPFAAYFYSVYGPGLNFANDSPVLSWLSSHFLPHIVADTSSTLIDGRNILGGALASIGFLGFSVGAIQVYYRKLARKGPATGGGYNFIRHPQYASLTMCGLGLLLLWPRYVVLLSFIAMTFVYYFLARFEEADCEERFGRPYKEYKERTHMFLPFSLPFARKLPGLPKTKILLYPMVLLSCVVISMAAIVAARGLQSWSVNSLYGLYTDNAAYVSLGKADQGLLRQVVDAALSDKRFKALLDGAGRGTDKKFINYVLPADWYVSEVPMKRPEGAVGGHHYPKNRKVEAYRIVFTGAELRTGSQAKGKAILLEARRTTPIVEVVVDPSQMRVVGIEDPVAKRKYEGIPVPLY